MADGRGRVLVVEDDASIRDFVTTILADEGYTVEGAATGHVALHLLREWPADLILLDLRLPDLDGAAFRAEQQRQQLAGHAAVVVMSAGRLAPDAERELAAAALLAKPFDLDVLLDTVARCLPAR